MDKLNPQRTREEVVSLLVNEKPQTIFFTKVNGETTVMVCTLNPEFLPPVTESVRETPVRQRAFNADIIHAYSLDRKGWRSFRVTSVIAVTNEFDSTVESN